MISVPFELEQMEFGMLIPGIPLPEKSQKECGLKFLCLFVETKSFAFSDLFINIKKRYIFISSTLYVFLTYNG